MSDRPARPPDERTLREVQAAQLRTRARRWAIRKSALGTIFLLGALAHALGPEPRSTMTTLWMAFLVILSTVHAGLALRMFSRVKRRRRLWPFGVIAWGVLSVTLLRILIAWR